MSIIINVRKLSLNSSARARLGETSIFARARVDTDAGRSMAVNITLASPVNNTKFSKFEVTVLFWNVTDSSWDDVGLYDAPTGGSTKSYIDGLTDDYGYIQQSVSTSRYYLMKVTYSYDLVETTTVVNVNFNYTPLPQG